MPSHTDTGDDARIMLAPSVTATTLPGETVVLDGATGVYFSLEGIGPRIWELLGETTTRPALTATIMDEFDVDPSTCERDVGALIDELLDLGLVVVEDAGA